MRKNDVSIHYPVSRRDALMQWQVLWFVLAGFILGFTASTLWEWLYFRRERMRVRDERVAELEAELQQMRLAAEASRPSASRRAPADYYGPTVLLESEQAEDAHLFSLDAPDGGPAAELASLAGRQPSRPMPPPAASPAPASPAPAPDTAPPPSAPAAPVQAAPVLAESAPPAAPAAPQPERQPAPVESTAQPAADSSPPAAPQAVEEAVGTVEQTGRSQTADAPLVAVYLTPPAFVETRAAAAAPSGEAQQTLPGVVAGYPDNLSRVKGIGRTYMRRLFEAGIFTFHQLGQADVDALRAIANPPVSANVEEWPQEARRLAEKLRRVGAGYRGPLPDDLTQIRGIGARTAQELYRAGIVTYEQLAAATPEQLVVLIPVSPSGEPIDYSRWVEGAARLAAGKKSA